MDESLTQRRHVEDEAFRGVNSCREERKLRGEYPRGLTVPPEEAPANFVPAAAVIRRERALSGITGRKEHVGGFISWV